MTYLQLMQMHMARGVDGDEGTGCRVLKGDEAILSTVRDGAKEPPPARTCESMRTYVGRNVGVGVVCADDEVVIKLRIVAAELSMGGCIVAGCQPLFSFNATAVDHNRTTGCILANTRYLTAQKA